MRSDRRKPKMNIDLGCLKGKKKLPVQCDIKYQGTIKQEH